MTAELSTTSAASRRVPKLGHKKSMFGCQRCRARRVKCNEAKPVCHNCERHQMPCVYDRDGLQVKKPTRAVSSTSFPAPSTGTLEIQQEGSRSESPGWHYFGAGVEDDDEDPPESRARRVLEARLMHQYVTETGSSVAIDDTSRPVFAKLIPELAFRSDALLYSMYTVTALHLTRLGKDIGLSLDGVAAKYFSIAMREHKKEISRVSRETVDLVCLTSCLVRNYASVQMQDRPRRPYTPPWEWLLVTKSSTTVFEEAWRLVGVDPSSPSFQLIKGTRHIHHKECKPNWNSSNSSRSRRRLGLLMDRSLSECDDTPEPWDAGIQKAYENTLHYIGDVLDETERNGPSGNACRMLIIFPMLVEKRFVDVVRAGAPRALVILAHYFSLLAEYDYFWWIGDSSVQEVRAIAGELTGKWKELMDWPLQMIEK